MHVKNHYVPELYLNNWAVNGKISVYNNLVSHKNVPLFQSKSAGSICYMKHLYTNRIDKVDYDNFERWINNVVETPYKTTQDKIINGEKLRYDDYQNISRFVFAQYLRVPKYYATKFTAIGKNIESNLEKMLEETINKAEKRIKHQAPLILTPTPKLIEEIPLNISFEKISEENYVKLETLFGRKMWLSTIQRMVENKLDVMRNYKWQIIEAMDGYEWYTSDNPVILLNYWSQEQYDFNGSWAKKHTNILMPISPRFLLFTEVGSRMPFKNNVNIQKFFNKCIIENSFLQVYSTTPNKTIPQIQKRIVNADEYKRMENMLFDWHMNQSSGEDEFSKHN